MSAQKVLDADLAAHLAGLARFHDGAAAACGLGPDTRVECRTCGRTETVDGATAMRFGWPRCCDGTMRLVR